MTTHYFDRVNILAELLVTRKEQHPDDEELAEFVDEYGFALIIAHLVDGEIVLSTEKAEALVNEAFEALLNLVDVADSDEGFPNLSELLGAD